jgi:hypothetical protein
MAAGLLVTLAAAHQQSQMALERARAASGTRCSRVIAAAVLRTWQCSSGSPTRHSSQSGAQGLGTPLCPFPAQRRQSRSRTTSGSLGSLGSLGSVGGAASLGLAGLAPRPLLALASRRFPRRRRAASHCGAH